MSFVFNHHKKLVLATMVSVALFACSDKPATQAESRALETTYEQSGDIIQSNPLLQDWDTPFATPPFAKIKLEHYMPAYEYAMSEHNKEIDTIAQSEAVPTFDNTIAEMEKAGQLLNKVRRVFSNIARTESNEEVQAIQRDISPKLTRHRNQILMNEKLFERIKAIHDQRKDSGIESLNAEQIRLTERVYRQFVRAGANLTPEQRTRLAQINESLSSLSTQFGQNRLNDTAAFSMVLTKDDLDGLPKSVIDAASAKAKSKGLDDKYVITLQRSSVQPFLQFSSRRDLRKKAFEAWAKRGDNDNEFDNKSIISDIVKLRAERAQLLGYEHHSDYVLSTAMASTPQAAMDLLLTVWEPALKKVEQEKQWILELMEQEGVEYTLEPWDWRYYAEKVRKAKFDLDQSEVTQYFELNNMIEAQFYVANRLFGLSFKERTDIPLYNPVVRVWEVSDQAGAVIGLFYGDYYAREGKRSGAWMSSFRTQQKLIGDIKPVVLNNMNLNKPNEGEPTLMTYGDAVTLFHEFGHALHGLLSNVTYPTLAGTSVPRDWVEFPAQIYEHFIAQPEIIRQFARHYQTNEAMPDELIAKIKNASTFNQGFATIEYLSSALVDMAYHQMRSVDEKIDVRAFEDKVLEQYNKPEEIIMRHRSTHFGHIFSGGYSSAYYAYMWSEILDADGFDAFVETGDIFDAETAKRLYDFVLSTGDSLDYLEAYIGFRGRAPTTDALLRNRGLNE